MAAMRYLRKSPVPVVALLCSAAAIAGCGSNQQHSPRFPSGSYQPQNSHARVVDMPGYISKECDRSNGDLLYAGGSALDYGETAALTSVPNGCSTPNSGGVATFANVAKSTLVRQSPGKVGAICDLSNGNLIYTGQSAMDSGVQQALAAVPHGCDPRNPGVDMPLHYRVVSSPRPVPGSPGKVAAVCDSDRGNLLYIGQSDVGLGTTTSLAVTPGGCQQATGVNLVPEGKRSHILTAPGLVGVACNEANNDRLYLADTAVFEGHQLSIAVLPNGCLKGDGDPRFRVQTGATHALHAPGKITIACDGTSNDRLAILQSYAGIQAGKTIYDGVSVAIAAQPGCSPAGQALG